MFTLMSLTYDLKTIELNVALTIANKEDYLHCYTPLQDFAKRVFLSLSVENFDSSVHLICLMLPCLCDITHLHNTLNIITVSK